MGHILLRDGAKTGASSRGRWTEEVCINLELLKDVTFNGYKINGARKDYPIKSGWLVAVLIKDKKWKILFLHTLHKNKFQIDS